MEKKQRFSLRKYKSGIVSVLVGTVFLTGMKPVLADHKEVISSEVEASIETVVSQLPDSQPLLKEASTSGIDSSDVASVPSQGSDLAPAISKEATSETAQLSEQEREVPFNKETHDWLGTSGAWEKGYKGQGKVIAVIDTGIDAQHDAMRLSDVSLAKFKNSADIEAKKKEVGITYGSWVSDKIVFAHNYVENNDNIKEGSGLSDDLNDPSLDNLGLEDIEIDPDAMPQSIRRKRRSKYRSQSASASPNESILEFEDFGGIKIEWPQYNEESEYESHGMHVTGIAAANPLKASPTGQRILGVAPEAQVMFMRVFANNIMGTTEPLFIKAIEDAVALGADAINLSLGSANGSHLNGNAILKVAIEKARQAGVSVVVAGGNERVFGSDHDNPFASNPDYGLVGDPSTGRAPISVASMNHKMIAKRLMKVKGLENYWDLDQGKAIYTESTNYQKIKEKLGFDKEHDFVYLENINDQAHQTKDVKDKIVLIQNDRSKTYSQMIAQAHKLGAKALLIFNNIPGQANHTMELQEEGKTIPSAFISHEFGKAMSTLNGNGQGKLIFEESLSSARNQKDGTMNYFSNWGLSSDGYLKPDITAPGGDVYSTYNDNHYGSDTGTSMAAPHIAGASLLVKQYLEKVHPQIAKDKIADLVKNLLMSNARVHTNPKTQTTSSPRQQGAGLLNVDGAVTTGLYLTGKDKYGSITLGNVEDHITFEVTIHNISNEAKFLRYSTELLTDDVDETEQRFSLTSKSLKTYDGEIIELAAHSQKTITITLDTKTFAQDLSKQMPNGYYLEGFVRFVDSKDSNKNQVNIPFVGFRGEFENLAVAEESIYTLKAQGKHGFYFEESDLKDEIYVGKHFTGLVSIGSDTNVSVDTLSDNGLHTLGTFRNKDGKFILERNAQGNPVLAISPNGDNNQDFAAFKAVFLRKYHGLKASIYAVDDIAHQKALWTSPRALQGEKNFNSDIRFEKSTTLLETKFAGKALNGADLADGKYHYVISYYPDVIGAKRQEMTFELIIDREKPLLTSASYNPKTKVFKPAALIDRGQSGVLRDSVFYLEMKNHKPYTITINDGYKYVSATDNKQFVERQADGSFILPLDKAELGELYYMVEDFAGNVTIAKLGKHLPKNIGHKTIEFSLKDDNYNISNTIIANLVMTANDSGLVSNQASQMISNRNQPISHLTRLAKEAFISPNEDGNKDFVAFKGLPNKVYNGLQITVYAKEDSRRKSPVWSSQEGANTSDIQTSMWTGLAANGLLAKAGQYVYLVSYKDAQGHAQEEAFTVHLVHKKPIITKASFQEEGDYERFRPAKEKAISQVDIVHEEVFYLLKKDGRKYDVTIEGRQIKVSDNKVVIPRNADGSYSLPKVAGVSPADFYYLVEDRAGNVSYISLESLRSIGKNHAVLDIALDYEIIEKILPTKFTYLVRNHEGKVLETLDYYNGLTSSLLLPFGKYSIELMTYDTNITELISDKVVMVELDAENSFKHIDFKMKKAEPGMLRVLFDQMLPEGSKVLIKAEDGQILTLDQSLYVPSAYGKMVKDGIYTVVIELPVGYQVEGLRTVTVLQNDVTDLNLSLRKDKDNSPQISHEDKEIRLENKVKDTEKTVNLQTQAISTQGGQGQTLPATGDETTKARSLLSLLILALTGFLTFSKKEKVKKK
ncbi:YSIRK signal domain/LPXTG anchor domain surface protein [Streptococcus didelphis]|uniref:YSIRK signal domain/LPXTG anchor domain surface protein n=1 Tax=Streptococcus didelphis TaxID=102886 RepID=UPI00036FD9C6|nr:YSIRK signal domain/LPXTG anchor domain surface protein [Streptococcus didelphis]